jgi:hypothetical protein
MTINLYESVKTTPVLAGFISLVCQRWRPGENGVMSDQQHYSPTIEQQPYSKNS